ncbi:MAG: hypothetical protein M3316_05810, partial [Actinomycetota bacterium]|nr:hypothetical protein [Actinomycetota bacterium]
MVEAGAVPEPLRGVQAEGEDEPLGHPGPDGVIGYLEVGLIERCPEQLSEQGSLVLAHRLYHGDVPPEPVQLRDDVR